MKICLQKSGEPIVLQLAPSHHALVQIQDSAGSILAVLDKVELDKIINQEQQIKIINIPDCAKEKYVFTTHQTLLLEDTKDILRKLNQLRFSISKLATSLIERKHAYGIKMGNVVWEAACSAGDLSRPESKTIDNLTVDDLIDCVEYVASQIEKMV